ncbi:hypothetical protein GCM10010264_21570 [Streptomyces globisporus]|uniref:Uncharacterized protein n=2 Tax=Streptomyces TaxID=1883 RepID=A0A5D4JQK8_9ACTN|nr:hypothetical protein FY004_00400 [Streptomyces parvus]GGW04509.1 hypothetical protein GCM10010264_21570 [Streptomyces globisporus]
MVLTARILRAALARPAVLMAVSPGATEARLCLERELRQRGWPMAEGPAEANVLAMVGNPDPDDSRWTEGLWAAVPAPKARFHLVASRNAGTALDEVATALLRVPPMSATPVAPDPPHHSPGTSPEVPPPEKQHASEDHAGHGRDFTNDEAMPRNHHGAADERDFQPQHAVIDGRDEETQHPDDAERREHAGHGLPSSHGAPEGSDVHGGHTGHDMGMEVAGLPMADRSDDRDGLRLDQLHVSLGPALLDWPAGLILHLSLQGDVIQRAHVEQTRVRTGSVPPFWDEPWLRAASGEQVSRGQAARRLCAAHLDSVGRLLAVAGWQAEARRARVARDVALAGRSADDVVAALRPLVRRVGRSRTLRWLTFGLGELGTEAAASAGLSGPALAAGGDVWDRLALWIEEAARSAALCDKTEPLDSARQHDGPRGIVGGDVPPSQALLDVLPRLLEGAEFAGARLIVASLDPDLDELVSSSVGGRAPHG